MIIPICNSFLKIFSVNVRNLSMHFRVIRHWAKTGILTQVSLCLPSTNIRDSVYICSKYLCLFNRYILYFLIEKIEKRWPHYRQGLLWFYGDSAAKKLHNSLKNTALCKTLFRRCDYSYSWVYQIENYNLTLQQYVKNDLTIAKAQTDDLDFNISRVVNEISQVLFHPEMDDKSVIILNCGLHFVENTNFSNYQRLIDRIIDLLNKSETGEGKGKGKIFRGKLIWKSTTAINRQKYTGNHLHSRRFLTYQVQNCKPELD